ncbi:MAG: UDP-N-acetylmuramate dehydrogenase [Paludibacteraceae bacterium]|nr:UDP-N-acetylmuramate dehydrogenase [Prevotella sp.]MBQ8706050.1 UDP-N-acetylmuramate dehydrogenase [Paludibacteraceae bacterium]MBQ8713978.1 UDP-N-acetylmuramate dehydrogenase [Prevotella sp.]
MKDLENYNLLSHNTFGIDVRCQRYLEYTDVKEAQQVAEILRASSLPYIIIGGGSNLLLTQDFEGIVVRSSIRGLQIVGSQLSCGSGEVWDDVVAFAVQNNLYGAENLSLIPGEVGASAVQNIGAYGVEVKDLIIEVEAVEIATGKICVIPNKECEYAYRQSRFKQDWKNRYLITHVTYRFQTDFNPHLDYGNIRAELERKGITTPTARQLRQVIIDIREAKLPDPRVTGNAGSFFMNPIVSREKYEQLAAEYEGMPHYTVDADHEKIPAGWMIDLCGWKGKSMGRAGVHDKQALVLVNRGGATGQEIVNLCKAIQQDVKEKFDIEIYPEVNII